MDFERLSEKCERIAKDNGIKWRRPRRTTGRLPGLNELVKTCLKICLDYKDWYQIIRLGTGIKLPMEFLDTEQTRLLLLDAAQVARASNMPAYLLLRTYDAHFANDAIREMLKMKKKPFANWIPTLNILTGMIMPSSPLFELVSKNRNEHEKMIRLNILWFMRANEVFFRYRDQLLMPMIRCLRQNAGKQPKPISFVSAHAYNLESYELRMQTIVSSLRKSPFAEKCLRELMATLDEPAAHRSREPFRLDIQHQGPIYLKPIDAFLDSKEFFPVLIFYQVQRFSKLATD